MRLWLLLLVLDPNSNSKALFGGPNSPYPTLEQLQAEQLSPYLWGSGAGARSGLGLQAEVPVSSLHGAADLLELGLRLTHPLHHLGQLLQPLLDQLIVDAIEMEEPLLQLLRQARNLDKEQENGSSRGSAGARASQEEVAAVAAHRSQSHCHRVTMGCS